MQISGLNIQAQYNATTNASPSKADKQAAQKQAERVSALNTLKAAAKNNQGNNIRKAHAQQRLQQIKQMVEMLKKLYAGDPKKLAQAMAGLVKELKSIVQEFGSSIGSTTGIDTNTNTNTAASATDADSTAAADAAVANADATGDEAAAAQAQAALTAATNTNDDSATKASGDKTSDEKTGDEKTAATTPASASDEDNEIKQFAKDVRDLMRKIKAAFQSAKGQMTAEKSTKTKAEAADDDAAIKDFEDAEKDLNRELGNLDNMTSDTSANGAIVSLFA